MGNSQLNIAKIKLEAAEVTKLITEFQNCTLPRENWAGNDRAHLIVGAWFCWRFDLYTAITKLRVAIKSFNESKGVQNTETNGYHETITIFLGDNNF